MRIKLTGFHRLVLVLVLLIELLPLKAVHAAAISIVYVTSGSSDAGFNQNAAVCTLREAIRAVNDHASFDGCIVDASTREIFLPDGNFVLNRYGMNDQHDWYGDLDIRTSLTIRGMGASRTVIYQDVKTYPTNQQDRIFDIIDPNYTNGVPGMTVTIQKLTIAGGYAQDGVEGGGGIRNQNAKLILNGVTLRDNEAAIGLNGGGVMNGANAILEVHDSTFDSNKANMGGGVYNRNQASITNSLFVGNETITSGGRLDNDPENRATGFMHLDNVTLAQNSTSSADSGAGINNSGNLVGTHLTLVGNYGIGLFLNGDSSSVYTASLSGSILAYHTQEGELAQQKPDCQMQNANTRFTSGGYNLVENKTPPGDSTKACAFSDGTDSLGSDPLLATTLATIQNSTTQTFDFASTDSPAIDAIPAGHALCTGNYAVDQLYLARPADGKPGGSAGCDIGAYELGGAPTHITYYVFLPALSKTK